VAAVSFAGVVGRSFIRCTPLAGAEMLTFAFDLAPGDLA
jgi:hypothetical protein